jgi:hypothetical protein
MGFPKGSIHNPELRSIMRAEGLLQVAFEALAADDNYFKTTVNPATGASSITVSSFTKAYCPGWPVCPTLTYVETSGSDVTGISAVITGIDQFGDGISETVTASFVSGTGWVGTAVNAFRTLSSVVVTITGTSDVADTLIIGYAKKYGLGRKIGQSTDVIVSNFDGAADAGTVNVENSTYDIAGTPDGAKELLLLVHPGYYTGKQ